MLLKEVFLGRPKDHMFLIWNVQLHNGICSIDSTYIFLDMRTQWINCFIRGSFSSLWLAEV